MSLIRKTIDVVIKIVVIGIILLVLQFFVFGLHRVSDNNMYPALRDGDLCLMYQLSDYEAGDVVLYEHDGKMQFGRIFADNGTFDIQNDRPYLNGSQVTEENAYDTKPGKKKLPIEVKQGEYLVINDFRSNTNDSRNFGVITKKDIHGKVFLLLRRRGF